MIPSRACNLTVEHSSHGVQAAKITERRVPSWPWDVQTDLTWQVYEWQHPPRLCVPCGPSKVAFPATPEEDWLMLPHSLTAANYEHGPVVHTGWIVCTAKMQRPPLQQQPETTWTPPESPRTFGDLLTTSVFELVRSPHAGRELDTVLSFLRENQPHIYRYLLDSPAEGRSDELASILEFLGAFPLPDGVDLDEVLASKWELEDAGDLLDES